MAAAGPSSSQETLTDVEQYEVRLTDPTKKLSVVRPAKTRAVCTLLDAVIVMDIVSKKDNTVRDFVALGADAVIDVDNGGKKVTLQTGSAEIGKSLWLSGATLTFASDNADVIKGLAAALERARDFACSEDPLVRAKCRGVAKALQELVSAKVALSARMIGGFAVAILGASDVGNGVSAVNVGLVPRAVSAGHDAGAAGARRDAAAALLGVAAAAGLFAAGGVAVVAFLSSMASLCSSRLMAVYDRRKALKEALEGSVPALVEAVSELDKHVKELAKAEFWKARGDLDQKLLPRLVETVVHVCVLGDGFNSAPDGLKRDAAEVFNGAFTQLTADVRLHGIMVRHSVTAFMVKQMLPPEKARRLRDSLLEQHAVPAHIVPAHGAALHADEPGAAAVTPERELELTVAAALGDTPQVSLLLGAAGAGKSTVMRQVLHALAAEDKVLPVLVEVARLPPGWEQNAMQTMLHAASDGLLRVDDVRRLQSDPDWRVVWLLDGLDEAADKPPAMKKAMAELGRVIVSARESWAARAMRRDYSRYLAPSGDGALPLRVRYLWPFSPAMITTYVESVVGDDGTALQRCTDALEASPTLRELVANPFLLSIVVPMLTEPVARDDNDAWVLRLSTMTGLLDAWVEHGLDRRDAKPEMKQDVVELCERVALQMHVGGGDSVPALGNVSAAVREAAPLEVRGTRWRFVHDSIKDHFLARSLETDALLGADDDDDDDDDGEEHVLAALPTDAKELAALFERPGFLDALLAGVPRVLTQLLTSDQELMEAVAGRLREPGVMQRLEPLLRAVVAASARDPRFGVAAANAVSVAAWSGFDVRAWPLRGALLDGANLTRCDLGGADLRGTRLRGAMLGETWLRGALFDDAVLSGGELGDADFGGLMPPLVPEIGGGGSKVAMSAAHVAVGLGGGGVEVYELGGQRPRVWAAEDTGRIVVVAFSDDGARLAVCSRTSDKVAVFDVESGDKVWTGHVDDGIDGVTFFGDDEVAVACEDSTVRLLTIGGGERVLRWHDSIVDDVAYDGGTLVSGGDDGSVRVWDVACEPTARFLREPGAGEVWCVAVDNGAVAAGLESGEVIVWGTDGERRVLRGHGGGVRDVTLVGGTLVSGSSDGTARVWDVASGVCLRTIASGMPAVTGVALRGNVIACSGGGRWIGQWRLDDVGAAAVRPVAGHRAGVQRFAERNGVVASAGDDGTVRVWDAERRLSLAVLRVGGPAQVWAVAFESDDALVSGSESMLHVWERRGGVWFEKPAAVLEGHDARVCDVAARERLLVSGDEAGAVRVWQLLDGKPWAALRKLRGHSVPVHAVAVVGDTVVSGDEDGRVIVWTASSGDQRAQLDHGARVSAVAVRSGVVAIGDVVGCVSVWDGEGGGATVELGRHDGAVLSVSFATNDVVVSCSRDAAARVWLRDAGGAWRCAAVLGGWGGDDDPREDVASLGLPALLAAVCDRGVRVLPTDGRAPWFLGPPQLDLRGASFSGATLSEAQRELLRWKGGIELETAQSDDEQQDEGTAVSDGEAGGSGGDGGGDDDSDGDVDDDAGSEDDDGADSVRSDADSTDGEEHSEDSDADDPLQVQVQLSWRACLPF